MFAEVSWAEFILFVSSRAVYRSSTVKIAFERFLLANRCEMHPQVLKWYY